MADPAGPCRQTDRRGTASAGAGDETRRVPASRQLSRTLRPSRLLVVDDERPLTDLLADLLEEEGYEVRRAYDGQEALSIVLSDEPPDLVLSDVMMPKLSGTELVDRTRHTVPSMRLPFLLLSAGARPRLNWKDVVFMPKPLQLDRLLECVQQLLGDGSTDTPPAHRMA